MDEIADIMKYETAGDPVSGCKWTRKTTGKIAKQLERVGIQVSAKTVGRLLKKMNYSLRVNLKCLESGLKNPPPPRKRDQQFRYIRSRLKILRPMVFPLSVWIAKAGTGRTVLSPWRHLEPKPLRVLDHDFPSDAKGVALPYGIYDFNRNEGFVCVGTSRDTAEFAVDAIRDWWQKAGSDLYPDATIS